ncbi:TPA: 50S ribosomal protein L30 [Candidatus Spyradomonas excrementavium]|nr:50S ribosomal protein L30 [Candidatus Spyradomonas excrementavium]
MAKDKLEKVSIRLKKSLIGSTKDQIKVVRALGLKKTNDVVEHFNSATIMGMVNKVPHLVEVVK